MLRRSLFKRKTSENMGTSGSKEGTEPKTVGGYSRKLGRSSGRPSRIPGPFADKDPSRLRIFVSNGGAEVLESIKKDSGEDKGTVVSKKLHGEIDTSSLTLSGYQLVTMLPRMHFSRMRNYDADSWEGKAYENADAFVYVVRVGKSEEYFGDVRGPGFALSGSGWERDRFQISVLLRKPWLVENSAKPLLLLVNSDEDDEFDVERLVNLFGLGGNRLERPFRAVLYSTNAQSEEANKGTLKESLEWLAKAARSSEDEATAMTGSDTDEDGSVVTSSTTGTLTSAFSVGGHFILDYEPTLLGGNPTLQRFQPIQKGTHCPFARAAKLWGGKLADELKPRLAGKVDPVQEAAKLNAGPLAEFVARSNSGEPLDGFCLEIPKSGYGVEHLGEQVRLLLTSLAELDPSPGENAMKMGPIDHPHWRFRFAGEDFFLTTFAPVYGKDSSRHSFGARRSFLLFQPRTSFGRHGLTADTPASATNWDNPTCMRDKARVAFKKNGCPYHIPEELPYPVAEHVVKPIKDDGTTCVRWWEPRV